MTNQLAEAIAAVEALPPKTQDHLADSLLAELAWERWLAQNPEWLEKLAEEAREEIRQGHTEPFDVTAV